jgi:MFS transporter, PPP family, 3-phenylpropionic acid transporter
MQLAALYFCFYAAAALLVTFWPHYMTSLGFGPADIGVIFGGGTLIGIVAQPVLTGLSDRLGRPARTLQFVAIFSLAFLLGVPFVTGFVAFAALMWLSAAPRSAIVPLLDAATVRRVGATRFGGIRMWGSVGYGGMTAVFGLLARDVSYETAGLYSVPLFLILCGVLALLTFTLPRDTPPSTRPSWRALIAVARAPGLVLFLLVQSLHWAGMMYFNVYLSLHTKSLGHSIAIPSLAVLVSIAAEVVALFVARPFVAGRRGRFVLVVVMGVSALRWVGMAVVTDPVALIALQLLHFFSFGAWYAASIAQLSRYAPPERRGAVQGLFAAVVFGVGGGMGSWMGGQVVEQWSTQTGFYVVAGLDALALVACLAMALTSDEAPSA